MKIKKLLAFMIVIIILCGIVYYIYIIFLFGGAMGEKRTLYKDDSLLIVLSQSGAYGQDYILVYERDSLVSREVSHFYNPVVEVTYDDSVRVLITETPQSQLEYVGISPESVVISLPSTSQHTN